MSLDADLIVDRRRMRRKLTFWRVLAIAVIVLAIAGMAAAWSNRTDFAGGRLLYRACDHQGIDPRRRARQTSTGSRNRPRRAR